MHHIKIGGVVPHTVAYLWEPNTPLQDSIIDLTETGITRLTPARQRKNACRSKPIGQCNKQMTYNFTSRFTQTTPICYNYAPLTQIISSQNFTYSQLRHPPPNTHTHTHKKPLGGERLFHMHFQGKWDILVLLT